LFIDLLPSRINDLLKLSERYRIGQLFWPILSTIRLSDFDTIVLTLINIDIFAFCGTSVTVPLKTVVNGDGNT